MKTLNLLIVLPFLLLNFSCSHKPGVTDATIKNPSICQNSICKIKVEGYPQEVAVLIPPYANYKHVTLFLHGFSSLTSRDRDLSALMQDIEVEEAFKEYKGNQILMIPFSTGKNKDYSQNFKNKTDLRNFLNNVYKVFAMKVDVEEVQLIAQGGAYQTVQRLIQDRSIENENLKISDITLLNATEAQFNTRTFSRWLKSGENKITVIYFKNTPTEKKAMELWSLFSKEKPGKEGGISLGNADYVTLIPETEFRNFPEASWLLVRKWFGRIL